VGQDVCGDKVREDNPVEDDSGVREVLGNVSARSVDMRKTTSGEIPAIKKNVQNVGLV
jgi:hypothetical protein